MFQSEPVSKDLSSPSIQQSTHTLFLSVRNFVCKMAEDVELLMTLYDGKENRAFTENYVVRWSKDGHPPNTDQSQNLRVLFTVRYFCNQYLILLDLSCFIDLY